MTGGLPEHAIPCPWCGAQPGVRRTTRRGRKLTAPSREARRQAHTEARARDAPG